MNIAIVYATFYTLGGAEKIILWLTTELLQRGHEVTIFTSEYDKSNPNIPADIRPHIVELSAGGNYSTWLDWMWAGWRLRKRLQTFDIVNPHNFPANVWVWYAKQFSPAFPPILWYCQEAARTLYEPDTQRQQGRYHSVTTHLYRKWKQDGISILPKILQKSIFYGMTRVFSRHLLHKHIRLDQQAAHAAARILANSRYSASILQHRYQRHIETCHLGVPQHSRAPLQPGDKARYFLTVSRLEPLKHVDTIIKACDILKHRYQRHDFTLVVVGTGTQENFLKELVCQLDVHSQITFTGYISDAELEVYYSKALALVFVPEDEPFGLVPVEAMRHGTAVIVSNEGGPLETVIHNVTGIYVDPRSPEALAGAMKHFLDNREAAIQMGRNGRQHVLEQFTFSRFVDRFEEHLQRSSFRG